MPPLELAQLRRGDRTEIRVLDRRRVEARGMPTPFPVLVYARSEIRGEYDKALMVLERAWEEPLGSASPESLRAMCCASAREFRHYWIEERGQPWRPLDLVAAYQLRIPEDADELADMLLDHLYGHVIDDIPRRPTWQK